MTNDDILKYSIPPGQEINVETHDVYGTYQNHPELYQLTVSLREGEDTHFGKYKIERAPAEFGRPTGFYAPPKEAK